MKVRANADGSFEFEVDDIEEGIALHKKLTAQPEQRNTEKVDLNTKQIQLYYYLVDNDCEHGVTINAVAAHFEINNKAANQRLITLTNMGHLKRVGSGRYRAI